MAATRITRVVLLLSWITRAGVLASVAWLATGPIAAADQDKKAAPPTWTVVNVAFKGIDQIAMPSPPGVKGAKPASRPPLRFKFDEKGGRVVKGGAESVPYITIARAPNFKSTAEDFRIVDALGNNHGTPSTYVLGRNNRDMLVFKRANWTEFGELYLEGPGERRVALSPFLPAEEGAAWKLTTAKLLADGGQAEEAKKAYQGIIKQFPRTKAAREARQLLDKLPK